MINFFTKHRKVRGVITIFLTLIYLSVYLLIGMFVDGGRVRMARTAIEDVQQIATENVMSQYNRGLYEYYGLFGVTDQSTADIANDVRAQIEESIGFKIPEDTVETFLNDLWTGAGSALSNRDTLKSGESVIDGGGKYLNQILEDIKDSHKRFDPYGVNITKASASYIDLTEVEAIRAQMRDEMRYTAPLVLLANFFDVVNQFLSVGSSAKAISDIADILTAVDSKIDEKQQEYYESLNVFSEKFHDYVEEYYVTENALWGTIKVAGSIVKIVNEANNILTAITSGKTIKDTVAAVKDKISSFFFGTTKKVTNSEESDASQNIEEAKYNIPTDMHLNESGGFEDIIKKVGILQKIATEFDGDNGWPDGKEEPYTREVIVDYDDDGEPITEIKYFYDEHKPAVDDYADRMSSRYKGKIDNFINSYSKPAIDAINASIDKIESCMNAIDEAEGYFLSSHNNAASENSKDLYKQYMATYLRQWNDLANQKKVLLRIKHDLEKLNTILENSKNDLNSVCNDIKSESISQLWNDPKTKLSRDESFKKDIEDFQDLIEKMALKKDELEGLKAIQDTAEADSLQKDIFSLLSTMVTNKEKENEGIVEEGITDEKGKPLFGIITKHEKSDNAIYIPKEAEEKMDFDKGNVISRIKSIMNKAQEIIEAIPKNLVDNIYDETYILSHCRDYVHTYRYSKLTSTDGANIDTVLNPKFIKDQSATKYLTNEQFKDVEVTPAEIEYILWGQEDSRTNVTIMYANIFIIRLALNYIAIQTSPRSSAEVNALSAAALVFAPAVKFAAPLIYALPQSIYETKLIMYDCQKVNLWNGGPDLDLWDAIENIAKDTIEKSIEDIKGKAKKSLSNIKNDLGTISIVESVKANSPPDNIYTVANFLELETDLLKTWTESDIENGNNVKVDNKVKAGYSDYLLIYLFLRGINKKSQINNLQDVIETNMRKAQDDSFRLKNTYSQVAVETECTIKFVFMTQSFMRRSFSNSAKYDNYFIRTKTAFAY